MPGYSRALFAWAIIRLLSVTVAQLVSGGGGNSAFAGDTILCNGTFDEANATGIRWFQPGVAQGRQALQPDNNSGQTRPAAWAVTVAQTTGAENSSTQLAYWYTSNGANYSDDFSLGYDVCSLFMNANSFYNNTLYRGQSDNGSCLSTFDQPCVNALQQQTQQYALGLVSNPTPQPNSNLTETSLPSVCHDIATTLRQNWPHECSYFFNDTPQISGIAMTKYANVKYSDTEYTGGCSLNDTDATFYNLNTQSVPISTRPAFKALVEYVTPILNVFLPVANAEAPTVIGTAKTIATCIRADHINAGSWDPPALPAPTPIKYGSGGLGGGAIAGIVVGVVVGVALIVAGLAFWLWRKRRSARKAEGDKGEPESKPDIFDKKEHVSTPLVEAPAPESAVTELSPDAAIRPELPGRDSDLKIKHAVDKGDGLPAELDGNTRNSISETPATAYGERKQL